MKAEARPRRLIILGATGSIGRNTLAVVDAFPGVFEVAGLAAGGDYRLLAEQARRYRVRDLAMADPKAADKLRRELPRSRFTVRSGEAGIMRLVGDVEADMVVSAIVGAAGLKPTFAAIERGLPVALANKEALVMAGRLLMAASRRRRAAIIPVDSEHHALSSLLRGLPIGDVSSLTITASGGPFLRTPMSRLRRVTAAEALRHPTWRMGPKISVDSATLMNKGLELIEARWLFGLPMERIGVLVHPESLVHGLVHWRDGGTTAFLSPPDMRLPISAALHYPLMPERGFAELDLSKSGRLTFFKPDERRFPAMSLARAALAAGGTAPAVLNAANEIAVHAFLVGRLGFTDIASLTAAVLDAVPAGTDRCLDDVAAADAAARRAAAALVSQGPRRFSAGHSRRETSKRKVS